AQDARGPAALLAGAVAGGSARRRAVLDRPHRRARAGLVHRAVAVVVDEIAALGRAAEGARLRVVAVRAAARGDPVAVAVLVPAHAQARAEAVEGRELAGPDGDGGDLLGNAAGGAAAPSVRARPPRPRGPLVPAHASSNRIGTRA